ncbi:rubrerythrin-like domain-containing protein [Halobaculum sp. D14]
MPTVNIDPYSASEGLFECVSCGARHAASSNPGACRDCGGPVQNIAVSRE